MKRRMYNNTDGQKNNTRNSGIELIKILAMILIVIFHVVQTLRANNPYILYNDYVINLKVSTTNIKNFILILFSYFGILGNSLFFVCSAWFFLDSSKHDKRKWFSIYFEIWVISIIILSVTLMIRQGDISRRLFLESLFPTTFANNWYLTCYLLFYPLHPLLNIIIEKSDRKHLFRIASVMFILYCCFCFIKPGVFYSSTIILWITIYLMMAYLKLYLDYFGNSIKYNVILLMLGLAGYILIVFLTNYLGLHITFMNDKVLYWVNYCNPFLILSSIAIFNLMRRIVFYNSFINYISSLSMLIYIIHENLLLRTYFRPAMWNYIYQNYGYNYIISWVFVMTAVVFSFGLICSIIYDKTIRPSIQVTGKTIYAFLRKIYIKAETILLTFH